MERALYVHSLGTTFPPAMELNSPFPGISIQIINATQGSTVDNTNALSLLTANTLSAIQIQILRGLSIQCGSNAIKSDKIIITDATLGMQCTDLLHYNHGGGGGEEGSQDFHTPSFT